MEKIKADLSPYQHSLLKTAVHVDPLNSAKTLDLQKKQGNKKMSRSPVYLLTISRILIILQDTLKIIFLCFISILINYCTHCDIIFSD